jgi:hypothetical protein
MQTATFDRRDPVSDETVLTPELEPQLLFEIATPFFEVDQRGDTFRG